MALGSRRPFRDPRRPAAPRWESIIPIDQRQLYFPSWITQQLENTKYIGTNTFRQSALREYRTRKPQPPELYIDSHRRGKPEYFEFKNEHVRELVTIIADLDVGRPDTISTEDAVGALVARALHGHIPHPSMIGYSGTGAYAIWLLREPHSMDPPLHTKQNAHRWKMITDVIFQKIEDLKPDRIATSKAQWLKAPGTIDTKTGKKVVYLPFYIPNEVGDPSIRLYTLEELIEELDVPSADTVPQIPADELRKWEVYKPPPKTLPAKPKTGGVSKAMAPYRARYQDMETLAISRRGFREPHRYKACFYYFNAVRPCYGMTHEETEAFAIAARKMFEFNRRYCSPPLPNGEVIKILRTGKRVHSFAQTIVRDLGVTREEANDLDLRALIPKDLKDERERERKERTGRKHNRREEIDKAIRAGRPTPRSTSSSILTATATPSAAAARLSTSPIPTRSSVTNSL